MIALTDANKYKLLSGKLPKLLKVIDSDKGRERKKTKKVGGGGSCLMKIPVSYIFRCQEQLASDFHHHHCILSRFFLEETKRRKKNYSTTEKSWRIDEKTFSHCFIFQEATFFPLLLLSFFHVNKLYEKRDTKTEEEKKS